MRQCITLIISLVLYTATVNSQTLVTTSVLPRNAVLETFNGINCAYCPDGDYRSEQLFNSYPGRVVLIFIHTGPLADTLFPGQPDFRTPFGAAIDSLAASVAYPAGTVNRTVWPGIYNQPPFFPQNPPGNLAIRRPGWWDPAYLNQGAGADIILNGGNTPVNIGAACSFDSVSRELTVNIELYYTSTETQTNMLNVALTESGIIGIQSNVSVYDSNYVHNHMLRHLLTGQWGDTVTTTQQGTLVARTYTYIVPLEFNIDSCEISAFVTQADYKHTHTGITIAAKDGTTVGIDQASATVDLKIYPNPVTDKFSISGNPGKITSLFVMNITGEIVLVPKPLPGDGFYDVSGLSPGMYFLKISSGKTTSLHKLVIGN